MNADIDAATRAAYLRWAPIYPPVAHNPLMRAEQATMLDLWPCLPALRALDLASGTGRYSKLLEGAAAEVVAVDFCEAMVRSAADLGAHRVCASMMQLPLRDETFDVVVSGLAVGHAHSIDAWAQEVARVLRVGGVLLYSDFHADAARAGLTRSFKDTDGRSVTVPHIAYDLEAHRCAMQRAGLTLETVKEIRVGIELTESFAGSGPFYRQWDGLAIALVVRAHK